MQYFNDFEKSEEVEAIKYQTRSQKTHSAASKQFWIECTILLLFLTNRHNDLACKHIKSLLEDEDEDDSTVDNLVALQYQEKN